MAPTNTMKPLLLFSLALGCWAQESQPVDIACHDPGGCAISPQEIIDRLRADNALLRAQLEQLQKEAAVAAQVCAIPDLVIARAKTIQAQQAVEAMKPGWLLVACAFVGIARAMI